MMEAINKHNNNKKVKNILIVEDNQINQRVAKLILESLGYDVSIVSDGRTALATYQNGFDAILMDIGLPDISGVDVIKIIREQEKQYNHDKPICIVVFTAQGKDIEKECFDAGANDFTLKPLDMQQFKTIFSSCLGN